MLFHVTILKKYTNGKTSFQNGKEHNQKQHFEWQIKTNDLKLYALFTMLVQKWFQC